MRRLTGDALESATLRLVGQSRAFLCPLDSVRHEIGSLPDARAARWVEAIRLTLQEPGGPGTLCHLEQAASELLHALGAGDA